MRWVGESCSRYGGDPKRIHLMGHGLSAHLAMLTLTQEAVVLSREGHMERAYEREMEKQGMMRWDDDEEQRHSYGPGGVSSPPAPVRRRHGNGHEQGSAPSLDVHGDQTAWVDEPADAEGLPPGAVMDEQSSLNQTARLATQLGSLGAPSSPRRVATQLAFPSPTGSAPTSAERAASREQSLANAEASIPNGLRRVEIYSPEVEIPPIAGLILLAGVSDVIKGFRNEVSRSEV